jgi:phosphate transport system substrate-binding protein
MVSQFRNNLSIATLFVFLTLGACQLPKEETTMIGDLSVVSDETIAPVMDLQTKEFMRIWTGAAVTNEAQLTRKAIEKFANKEARFLIIARDLKPDELSAMTGVGEVYKQAIAYDAICFITNPKNPVRKLSPAQARDILTGKISNWSELGGKNLPIQLFISSPNDAQRDYLKDSLLRAEDFSKSAYPCTSSTQMKKFITEREDAFGYTSTIQARLFLDPEKRDTTTLKVLRLASDTSKSYLPTQDDIYNRRYTLAYPVFYVYPKNEKLPLGFAAFLYKEGQKVFQRNGATPFSPPVWIINFKDE